MSSMSSQGANIEVPAGESCRLIIRSNDPVGYHEELRKAKRAACLVGTFYVLSKCISFLSLLLATVVLLGAFVSSLLLPDFFLIPILLLLLEATRRIAVVAYFNPIIAPILAYLLNHGRSIDHHRSRYFLQHLQTLLIFPAFILPTIRLLTIHYHTDQNMRMSLHTFYFLIILNALVLAPALLIPSRALTNPVEYSVLLYYDECLQSNISAGISQIRQDVEFCRFAFKVLAREYAKNVQAGEVVRDYGRLMVYMYAHRRGMDYVRIYLDADDAALQEAAINMVGFWADPSWGLGLEDVKLPADVLMKLADKLQVGHVGWAAANSFGGLARRDPEFLKRTVTSSRQPVVCRLADLVDTSTPLSLTFVRTLVLFYNKQLALRQSLEPFPPAIEEVVPRLKLLLATCHVHRVRVQSAYLLHLLGMLDHSCIPLIEVIWPLADPYWFESERKMLEFFLQHIPHDAPRPYPTIRADDTHTITPPPWTPTPD